MQSRPSTTTQQPPQPEQPKREQIQIPPANMRTTTFVLVGTAPYVQNRFSKKAQIMAGQEAGSTKGSKKPRAKRDFEKDYEEAKHVSREGWCGIPAPAFRNAAISACRLVGYKMTLAKLSLFIVPDGFDKEDDMPLVKITKGKPHRHDAHARNANGSIDIRARPMWREWEATLQVQYDADQFTLTDIANLINRVGLQVGIGEGRHDSKESAGLGWGTFTILEDGKKRN